MAWLDANGLIPPSSDQDEEDRLPESGAAVTGGESPGTGASTGALRAAQSEALRKKVWFGLGRPYAHPYQWAAFQLYGDWH